MRQLALAPTVTGVPPLFLLAACGGDGGVATEPARKAESGQSNGEQSEGGGEHEGRSDSGNEHEGGSESGGLSKGIELGQGTPVDLAPGNMAEITLEVSSQSFDTWSAHPEVE